MPPFPLRMVLPAASHLKANMQMIATFSLQGSKGRSCSVGFIELCVFPLSAPFDF